MERSNNNRPKITLTIPQYNQYGGYVPPPQTAGIQTAGIPPQYVQPGAGGYAAGYNPFGSMYPQKAGEFMFKQFSGFRDFTMNTAKSGLSVGEKSAFCLYNKVSTWSRKWFTHIFLFLVVLCYSLAGAALFVWIEGSHEAAKVADIRDARYELVKKLRLMADDKELMLNTEKWEGSAIDKLQTFEGVLFASYKSGITNTPKKIWSFWNSMFYCGTIYTTIVNANMDAPAVVRRRRKIARQQREQTPEASKLGKIKYSDEESSSATDHRQPSHIPVLKSSISNSNPPEIPERRVEPIPTTARQASGHLSKILQRRDRKAAPTVMRSTSIPRDEMVDAKPSDIFNLMRKARRSLSQPRHKDESSDSARSPSPVTAPKKPLSPPSQIAQSYRRKESKQEQMSQFEKNIIRFEEERRRFMQEKRRFEHEKRELDLMRIRRAAEFEKNSALPPNLKRLTDRKPSDTSEDRVELIKGFNSAQKLMMSKSSDCVPKRNDRPSDYESSTESCSSDEGTDESDIEELVKSLPDNTKKLIKEEIVKEWVEESLSITLDDDGKPKIIANGAEDIDEPISNGAIEKIEAQTHDVPTKSEPEVGVVTKESVVVVNGENKVAVKEKIPKDKTKGVPKAEKKKQEVIADTKPQSRSTFGDLRRIWRELKADYPDEVERFRFDRNKCISDFIILVIYCGIGGMIFRFTEGSFENMYKCGVKRVKRDFVDQLWIASHSMREDDWKSLARTRLRKFEEELQVALEAGVTSYSGQKAWTFMNGVVYCMTVVTTIGYGHISPSTNTGRAITIVYAIFGIPLFLILLADFGKLFTRGIKFLWGFVRRVYYTRSCRKVRKTAQVQEVMRGINMVYDIATFRRPSMIAREEAALAAAKDDDDDDDDEEHKSETEPPPLPKRAPIASPIASPITSSTATPLSQASTLAPPSGHDSPTTPAPEVFEIDDEFNLPISLALFILLAYIIIGAVIYSTWEEWSFFESFYFVFISMSTIGFGDYVPQHPIYMMTSILYLVFGLALTSMCINVVQLKLSDHFRQASSKIGATIGLKLAEEEAARNSQTHTPVELASVHSQSPKIIEPGHLRFEFSPPQQMYIHPQISSPIHTPPPHVQFAPNFNISNTNNSYASSGEDGKKKKKEKNKKTKK